MKRWWLMKGIKIIFFILLTVTLMSFVVMWLWNWLMPALFSIGAVTFWQALGILILAKILFGFGHGGWKHHGGYYGSHWKEKGMHWKSRMQDKLKNMSPEDRDRFREEWRKKCGWRYDDSFGDTKKEAPDATTN